MLTDFISITDLQRHLKQVFSSKDKPMQIVMSNNAITGIVINKEIAEALLKSGALDQLREELWELNDPETAELVRRAKEGDDSDAMPFEDFAKEYGL